MSTVLVEDEFDLRMGDPVVDDADVMGLYPPDVAAAAGRATACNTGSTTVYDD